MYNTKMINEAEVMGKWAPIIESTTGISDKSRIEWMSKYCHNHELYENNAYAVYGAVNGMGQTSFPADPGTQSQFAGQAAGSGDKAHTLLPLAMQVAANTVGLDLVPVIPMPGPMGVLTYLDFVYGGGKLDEAGTLNNPATVKVDTTDSTLVVGDDYFSASTGTTAGGANAMLGTYLGTSRVDGFAIFEVLSTGTVIGADYTPGAVGTAPSIAGCIDGSWAVYAATSSVLVGAQNGSDQTSSASLVKALEDHLTGFSGNAFGSNDPYSRDTGESTQENVMNLTLFNKAVEAKTFQVAAAVTREQVQDLKQFGIDAVAQVEAVLANELTQSINKNILERLFKLGVTNHANIAKTQALSFDLALADTATATSGNFGSKVDSTGVDRIADFPTNVPATEGATVSNSENIHTRQRKIFSRVLAASNMIAIRGRRGNANFMVTNGQVATALQDSAGFIAAPMANTLNQVGGSLYPVGTIGGVAVYVDPNMAWADTRILVGRKGDGNSPGLVFMPYLMAESVETIAEGTMAPKIAVKSRFALVEAGHHPETNYLTFGVFSQYGIY
jgi:hypothetical protein